VLLKGPQLMFPDMNSPELVIVSDTPYTVIDQPTEWISVSKDIQLAARLWRPDITVPVPVVVEIIPYRRQDGTLPIDERMHPYWAGHGVATLRVDLRGCGDSDGILEDEYLKLEQDDAIAVIKWAEKQPWCNGNVGMTGLSWGGFAALQVAARRPKALKAIIAIGATVDRYNDDVHYKNGCLLNENFGWGTSLTAFTSRPPDPSVVGKKWRSMWLNRLENLKFFAVEWFQHQTRDDYWKHGSICENFDAIEIPVMIISGWNDLYVNALPALMDNLKGRCHAVCGPWAHHFPHLGTPGPSYDYLGSSLAWWRQWLSDEPARLGTEKTHLTFIKDSSMPNPFVMTVAGRWIDDQTWPLPSNTMSHLYMAKAGLTSKAVDAPPVQIHSPVDTGAMAGEWVPHCSGAEVAGCQRLTDAQSTCFDGDILDQAIDVFGCPEITISLQSNSTTGHLIVRLCDVAPSGSSELISIGVLNLTHRNGNENPIPMPVGETQSLQLRLDYAGHRFLPGHKIRIALSTAYWPFIWPAVENPVLTLAKKPACLSLPGRQKQEEGSVQVNPPIAPPASALTEKRVPQSKRQVTHDMHQGKTSLTIRDDLGEVVFEAHGLVTSAVKYESYEITAGDPLSSQARFGWEFEYSRDDWAVRTVTETQLMCDHYYYFLTATVRAYEQGKQVFERTFDHKIARMC
jgi:putative CocE/NonD family hydrolase